MLKVLDHPLITHKLAIMRDENTGTKDFSQQLDEIAGLMAYEVSRDLPVKEKDVKTPMGICHTYELAKKVVLVPVLRAGMGMVGGIRDMIPTAKVGFVGLYRDEETLEPQQYYFKVPNMEDAVVMVLDPMLATGGSMELAYKAFITKGQPRRLIFASVIASQQGVKYLQKAFPGNEVELYTAAIDPELNEHKYIVPGLGDAGDLCYGEKL